MPYVLDNHEKTLRQKTNNSNDHSSNNSKDNNNDNNRNSNNNNGSNTENVFTKPFLSLPVTFYHSMQLNLHLAGDDRGGAKEDACRIVVLILTQHLDEQQQQHPARQARPRPARP